MNIQTNLHLWFLPHQNHFRSHTLNLALPVRPSGRPELLQFQHEWNHSRRYNLNPCLIPVQNQLCWDLFHFHCGYNVIQKCFLQLSEVCNRLLTVGCSDLPFPELHAAQERVCPVSVHFYMTPELYWSWLVTGQQNAPSSSHCNSCRNHPSSFPHFLEVQLDLPIQILAKKNWLPCFFEGSTVTSPPSFAALLFAPSKYAFLIRCTVVSRTRWPKFLEKIWLLLLFHADMRTSLCQHEHLGYTYRIGKVPNQLSLTITSTNNLSHLLYWPRCLPIPFSLVSFSTSLFARAIACDGRQEDNDPDLPLAWSNFE